MKTEISKTILALDIGSKRIGAAILRANSKVPERLPALKREGAGGSEKAIIELMGKEGIRTIVVGLPLSAGGEETQASDGIRRFVRRIERRTECEIIYIDEWGTSAEAKERLGLPDNPNPSDRDSGVIDSMAASILLEAYIAEGSKD